MLSELDFEQSKLAEAGASDEEIAACSSNGHLLMLLESIVKVNDGCDHHLDNKRDDDDEQFADDHHLDNKRFLAAGEEMFVIEMMIIFGDMSRLRNYSSLFWSRELNLSMSIDRVDLSLPTCLLLQIHNGNNFDLMVLTRNKLSAVSLVPSLHIFTR